MRQTNSLATLKRKRKQILAIATKHGAYKVRVFGSVIRGQDRATSDIDFLVKRRAKTSPWFPAPLVRDLEALLGHPVDIVTERGLSPHLKKTVLSEAVPL